MRQRKGLVWLSMLLAGILVVAGCSGKGSSGGGGSNGKQKVAVVYNSVAKDVSWSQALHDGLEQLKKDGKIEYDFTENVANADAERYLRRYAEKGYDLIIAHSSVYKDATFNVAKEFPKVNFAWPSFGGKETAENVAAYDTPVWEASYLAGIVAAQATKTNKLGYVGGIELPGCKGILNGFREGAKTINPAIEVLSVYVGDFNDVAKAKAQAMSLADRGADVFSICGNGPAVGTIEAARERNLLAIGYVYDMSSLAPDHVLGSLFWDGGKGIGQLLADIKDSKFRPAKYYAGAASEGITTFKLNEKISSKVPAKATADLKAAVAKLEKGELKLKISFD